MPAKKSIAQQRKEAFANKPVRTETANPVDVSKLSERNQRVLQRLKNSTRYEFTPERIKQDIYDYLSHVMDANENGELVKKYTGRSFEMVRKIQWVPTIEGFCIWAGCSRAGLYNHRELPEYQDMIDQLSEYCKNFTVEEMLKENLPPIPAIFVGKSMYGMVEAQPKLQAPTQINIIGADQIAQAFLDVKGKHDKIPAQCKEVDPPGVDF